VPVLLLLLQEGEPGGFTPFSINVALIGWTVVIFLLLMAILWKWGWPAILKSVEEREHRIQTQLDEAEKARAEAQKLLEEHKRLIGQARAESQEILTRAKSVAQKEAEALLAKAHQEQDAILARAQREIAAEKEKAIVALRREAVDLSIAAASKLLERNLSGAANKKLVEDYIASIGKRA
jgi:F-type H+-transporting ATPase subunit b